MKIGELVKRTGVSKDTIRYYEKFGLLTKVNRPYEYNNYKDYHEENVPLIGFIKMMKGFGFTLEECKKNIAIMKKGEFDEAYRTQMVQDKLAEIDQKIADLQFIRDNFERTLAENCAGSCAGSKVEN